MRAESYYNNKTKKRDSLRLSRIARNMKKVEQFLNHWEAHQLCLHPTDTVPGISFNPASTSALEKVIKIKGRAEEKPYVSLIADLETALRFWRYPPQKVLSILEKFWPGPLSVVLKASAFAPKCLVSKDGYLALRCPKIADHPWMKDVLRQLNRPFPTTSVNISGQLPTTNWDDAVLFAKKFEEFFIPTVERASRSLMDTPPTPSTIVKFEDDGQFSILRRGVLTEEVLKYAK